MGARALVEVLASPDLLAHPRAQDGEVTYAAKLTKEDFHLTSDIVGRAAVADRALGPGLRGSGWTPTPGGARVDVRRRRACAAGSIALRDGAVVLGAANGAIALRARAPRERQVDERATAWWTGARLDQARTQWA